MLRMYCRHVAYCITLKCSNSHHQSSPQEILAVRSRAINLILDVPTFTTSRLPTDPSSQRWNYVGEKWPMNFAWNDRLPRSIQESFTCRKSTTWDRRLYFPSDGFTSHPKEGVLRIFSSWKIRRLRTGLNPRTWVPKASTLPLDHWSRYGVCHTIAFSGIFYCFNHFIYHGILSITYNLKKFNYMLHIYTLVILTLLRKFSMTYTIAECTVNKLLTMDRGTLRNL